MSFAALLPNRGIVRIGGEDRRTFLQGLISNDIGLCTEGQAIYAALLTPQGKFLHDFFIVEAGTEFLVDCDAARADDLIKRLSMFKLRAKVTLQNAAAEYDVWAIWDSKSSAPDIFADPRLPELGMRLIAAKGAKPKDDFTPADFAAYDRHRLMHGVADGSRDMEIDKSTLIEGNFDLLNGISWSKGCYMGQELTARMHYRGLAKKRLFPVRITGPAPTFGSILKLGAEEAGEMRSAAGDRGLALLNIEKVEAAIREGTQLICGESRLNPERPGWMKKMGEN